MFFKRYVGPSDSRHPSRVSAGLFTADVVDSGAAALEAALLDEAVFTVRVVFTGAGADDRSIEEDVGFGRAAADADDRFGLTGAVVFVSPFAVRWDGCDKAWASCAAPAALPPRSGEGAG